MLSTVIIERSVGDSPDVLRLGLTHPGHMDEDEIVGVDLVQQTALFQSLALVTDEGEIPRSVAWSETENCKWDRI